MTFKETTPQQQILSNRQLKEWNDNRASETETLYQLRCKHLVERDQLVFDKIQDTDQQIQLATQQQEELTRLKQANSERQLAMQKRHQEEKNALQRKLAFVAQQRKMLHKV